MTLKRDYKEFLHDNFNGLNIRAPLFFNWKIGLRFDLQDGVVGTDRYFEEGLKRSMTLFQAVFDPSDMVFLVLMDYKHKREKIRFGNFCFKQVHGLNHHDITFLEMYGLYEPLEGTDIRNVAVLKSKAESINFRNILKAIGNSDFPPRQPRLDKKGVFTSKEVFFLNRDKKLIFQMYDDRGLDIIASDIEELRPIYDQYNNWLLNSNRNHMERLFETNNL